MYMNKNTSIVIGIIVVAVVVLIGWGMVNNNPSLPVTDNPVVVTDQTSDQTLPITSQSGVPVAVTSQKVIPTGTTVVLTGSAVPNGALTSYWFEYGPSPSLGRKTNSQIIGSGFVSIPTPIYLVGLAKNTTYYFQLKAQNRFGTVAGQSYAFQTTAGLSPIVGGVPKVVTSSASNVSTVNARLNGKVTPNQAPTQYWFEYGQTTDLGRTTAFVSVGDGSAVVLASASLTGLNPATTYYFRLNAQNQFGTVNGDLTNFKTVSQPILKAPSVSTRNVSALSTSTATVHGLVNPNGATTKYWFEYSDNSLSDTASLKTTSQISAGSGSNTTSVQVDLRSLVSKNTYYYRLVAQNSTGLVRGETASFKTK